MRSGRGSAWILAFGWLFSGLLLSASAGLAASRQVGSAVCGNGTVEEGEECDDGGICIGGPKAGEPCTSEEMCEAGGVCVGGARQGVQCNAHVDCPFGRCVRCRPFGGDHCAANCTKETDVVTNFVPGLVKGNELVPGTSGIIVNSGFLNLAIAVRGFQTWSIGKARDGQIPVAVRASSVDFPRVSVAGLVCGCARGIAAKTCGGTLFEADGVTLSRDCTPVLTAGDAECVGRFPCTFVNGPGNSAAGAVGCGGIEAVNISVARDCGAPESVPPNPPELVIHGANGPGSAVLTSSTLITAIIGSCTGSDPAMGPDGEFCTDDDDWLASPRLQFTLPATTAAASAVIHNASNQAGIDLGPVSAQGAPFDCQTLEQGLAQGATLAGVLAACDQNPLGDLLARSMLAFGEPRATPTPEPTGPTPTPTPTPLLIRGDRRNPQRPAGCQVAWRVMGSDPMLDRYGMAANRVRCTDGDPGCDFAVDRPGLCEFLAQVCLNVVDPIFSSCRPNGVQSVEIMRPDPRKTKLEATREVLAADRFALQSALQHLRDPARPGAGFVFRPPLQPSRINLCSAPFPVQVLVGGMRRATVTLAVRSEDFSFPSRVELSSLKLTCERKPLRTDQPTSAGLGTTANTR
ncbi:MAG: hypothetical protein N3C12_12375 [Candidatus Binatia bacterium]|nr:hypothetical protein [Candidatus Binatia bacterium]